MRMIHIFLCYRPSVIGSRFSFECTTELVSILQRQKFNLKNQTYARWTVGDNNAAFCYIYISRQSVHVRILSECQVHWDPGLRVMWYKRVMICSVIRRDVSTTTKKSHRPVTSATRCRRVHATNSNGVILIAMADLQNNNDNYNTVQNVTKLLCNVHATQKKP